MKGGKDSKKQAKKGQAAGAAVASSSAAESQPSKNTPKEPKKMAEEQKVSHTLTDRATTEAWLTEKQIPFHVSCTAHILAAAH